ncbi:MAG: 30S ribosomal protein S30e [Nitrososphaerales archaeon]
MPTHGSLTKAGKVKSQTPKLQARERISHNAKLRNKLNFRKRFELKRKPGQNWSGRRGRR